MTENTLFKKENLKFASYHEGVVGSLYFFCADSTGVYRGRIRLAHEHGPQINYDGTPQVYWVLGREAWFTPLREKFRSKPKQVPTQNEVEAGSYGNLLKNFENTIQNAHNEIIHEIYNSRHQSRGKLVMLNDVLHCGSKLSDIRQENIDSLRSRIGAGGVEKNVVFDDITWLPKVLHQKKGVYGC